MSSQSPFLVKIITHDCNTPNHLSQKVYKMWPLYLMSYHAKEKINRYWRRLATKRFCVLFPQVGWTCQWWWMLGVYDFLGSEGASIGAAFPFMLLENPDSQMRAKRRDRRGGKGKRPHSGEQTRWLREGCRKKTRKSLVLCQNPLSVFPNFQIMSTYIDILYWTIR